LARLFHTAPAATVLQRAVYADINSFLVDSILAKVDAMTMAHALEARVPLLDREVVELASSIPDRLKMRWGRGKRIFKKAVRARLPREVIARAKSSFQPPLAEWLRTDLRATVGDVLSGGRGRARRTRHHGPDERRVRCGAATGDRGRGTLAHRHCGRRRLVSARVHGRVAAPPGALRPGHRAPHGHDVLPFAAELPLSALVPPAGMVRRGAAGARPELRVPRLSSRDDRRVPSGHVPGVLVHHQHDDALPPLRSDGRLCCDSLPAVAGSIEDHVLPVHAP